MKYLNSAVSAAISALIVMSPVSEAAPNLTHSTKVVVKYAKMAPCPSDEGEQAGPCVWDHRHMGIYTGGGHSFWVSKRGVYRRVTHQRAHCMALRHIQGECLP